MQIILICSVFATGMTRQEDAKGSSPPSSPPDTVSPPQPVGSDEPGGGGGGAGELTHDVQFQTIMPQFLGRIHRYASTLKTLGADTTRFPGMVFLDADLHRPDRFTPKPPIVVIGEYHYHTPESSWHSVSCAIGGAAQALVHSIVALAHLGATVLTEQIMVNTVQSSDIVPMSAQALGYDEDPGIQMCPGPSLILKNIVKHGGGLKAVYNVEAGILQKTAEDLGGMLALALALNTWKEPMASPNLADYTSTLRSRCAAVGGDNVRVVDGCIALGLSTYEIFSKADVRTRSLDHARIQQQWQRLLDDAKPNREATMLANMRKCAADPKRQPCIVVVGWSHASLFYEETQPKTEIPE